MLLDMCEIVYSSENEWITPNGSTSMTLRSTLLGVK